MQKPAPDITKASPPDAAAIRVAGHFGEWLQGRLGPDGPVALVTLHCEALCVRAGTGPPPLPNDVTRRFAAALGRPLAPLPGLSLDMPPGGGAGASTATLVALARLAGFDGDWAALARACVAAEGASDPLMLPRPDAVLWASRQGAVLQDLAPPPRCTVVGGFWGGPQRTDSQDDGFADIADLDADWQRAVAAGDLRRCAAIASDSAARCAALRGGDAGLADLARDLGALGQVRAHTGSARGLIFAAPPSHAESALQEAGLTGVLRFETGGA